MREFGFGIALAAMLVAVDAPAAVVVTLGGTSDGTRGLVSSVDNTQTIDFDSVTTLVDHLQLQQGLAVVGQRRCRRQVQIP